MFPANLSCQLFGTLGCHLCEQAEETLKPLLAQGDICERPEWLTRYSLSIPVLRHEESGAELNWPFDTLKVIDWLRACQA